MLIYVRHGKTDLNQGGDGERLRGWLPVPLTAEGVSQAHQAGQRLAGLKPSSFHTSDLPRALQTAHIVGGYLGTQAEPTAQLRDWHTGHLAGQKFTDIKDQLFHHIDHPDVPVPLGEPIHQYLDRFTSLVKPLVADGGQHVVVGHARGSSILQGIGSPVGGKGQHVDPAFLKTRPDVHPGGIMVVHPDWSIEIHNPPPVSTKERTRQGIIEHMVKA